MDIGALKAVIIPVGLNEEVEVKKAPLLVEAHLRKALVVDLKPV
jgi:hypothetical protein